ncbi:unnamed protein product, partial [Discosporangium mesarthrocarpum]
QVPKRNHPHAVTRGTFKDRGPGYSDKGVFMRCARPDQSTATVTLHHVATGGATVRFSCSKQEFLVPAVVVLRALRDTSDQEIHARVLRGEDDNTFLAAQMEVMLRDAKRHRVRTREESLSFIGAAFRTVMGVTDLVPDVDVGKKVIDR